MTVALPQSEYYLAADNKKCAGCLSCMLACSLVHEGEENLTLSRIQIMHNVFGDYPQDIQVAVCRQCPKPLCVQACPLEPKACYIDTEHGNTRVIDETKCNGCGKCIEACPFTPHMPIWNAVKKVAIKCDLCLNTPFWSEKGGPGGGQACVEVCPVNAIRLVKRVPKQSADGQANASHKEKV
jgi:protein NrfC